MSTTILRSRLLADGFATGEQSQTYLGVDEHKLQALVDDGTLPHLDNDDGELRIPWRSLRDYAARRLVNVGPDEDLVLR